MGTFDSSDGNKIMFTIPSSDNSRLETYVINADGTNQTRLSNDQEIKAMGLVFQPHRGRDMFFSAAGSRIAFGAKHPGDPATWASPNSPTPPKSSHFTYADIYVMNADGPGLTNITNSPQVNDVEPSFTPDGKKIAFVSNPVWDDEIYLMNPDGANPVNLTNRESANDHSPRFSADGKKMVFESHWSEEPHRRVSAIYVADIVSN
jgi:Tol biopolymer transport system component